MDWNLTKLLSLLPVVGPIVGAIPTFKAFYDEAKAMLSPKDQETAKAAYRDLMDDNDEGFARLDAKLEAAKNR